MKEAIDKAIKALAEKSENAIDQDAAMKYSQSVLNLANAQGCILADDREYKKATQ